MITATVTAGQLPEGTCYQSEQARLNGTAANLQVTFPVTASLFNYGTTTPTADQREFPWYRLNPDGTPDRWYSYINGQWIAAHPIPASSPISQFYRASLGSIDTYDGGTAGAITATTGPMWALDSELSGLMPVGVSANFPFNTTGGEIQHVLSAAEQGAMVITGAGQVPASAGSVFISELNGSSSGNRTIAATQGHNNMPPYRAGYWIKRTLRGFYVI